MHPMSAEPIAAEGRAYREAPGIPQELIGVTRSMEVLIGALEELGLLVPQLENRLSPILVEAGNYATPSRITETTPLRSGLADSIDLRSRQIQEVTDALRGILERIDL